MERSKEVYISYEDLIYGIYSILINNGMKLVISYEKIYEYEAEVINYLVDDNYEVIVDSSDEKKSEFIKNHQDIIYESDKMIILEDTLSEYNSSIDLVKYQALNNEQATNILVQRELIKKNSIKR